MPHMQDVASTIAIRRHCRFHNCQHHLPRQCTIMESSRWGYSIWELDVCSSRSGMNSEEGCLYVRFFGVRSEATYT
eukprot:31243-Eustigmatos_ZCMA.PRE.1